MDTSTSVGGSGESASSGGTVGNATASGGVGGEESTSTSNGGSATGGGGAVSTTSAGSNSTSSGGASGAAGAGGSGGSPAEPEACSEPGLTQLDLCDPDLDPIACTVGSFDCGCMCECASCQSLDPCPCSGPCEWWCRVPEVEQFATVDDARVLLDCSSSERLLTVSADVTYVANDDGPPIDAEVTIASIAIPTTGDVIRASITNQPITGAEVGPVSPGENLTVSHQAGPAPYVITPNSADLCDSCGQMANVSLSITFRGGGADVYVPAVYLGGSEMGLTVPLECP